MIRTIRKFYDRLPTNYKARLRAFAGPVVGPLRYVRALKEGFRRYKKWEANNEVGAFGVAAYAKPSAVSSNPLQTYFDSHIEGRGIWKWEHYFEIYHRHFSKFIGQEVHVLEIGVYSGGSLEMWKQYFGPKCQVYGVDIHNACRSYADDSVKIFIGDQADHNFWTLFKKKVPFLDIVIDDGGHKFYQQRVTLDELLPHLRPGGVYLCEDVPGAHNSMHGYISGLSRNLHANRRAKANISRWPTANPDSFMPTPFQQAVHSVHLYPFAAVIEKTESPVSEFISRKQGTQWEPFI